MEPVFKNAYVYTMEDLKEIAQHSMVQKYKITAMVLAALCCLLAVLLWLLQGPFVLIAALLISAVLVLFKLFRLPTKLAGQTYRRNQVMYQAQPRVEVDFFDDQLQAHNESSKAILQFTYDKIVRIKETKNLYLLLLPEQLVVMVQKRGFISGQPAEFVPFLKQKCPDAARRL
ncbi:MAG: YcxB family protein [Pygmaiobacter sp.]|nr:YcxB family protein [Pygmaiobacter sp.]